MSNKIDGIINELIVNDEYFSINKTREVFSNINNADLLHSVDICEYLKIAKLVPDILGVLNMVGYNVYTHLSFNKPIHKFSPREFLSYKVVLKNPQYRISFKIAPYIGEFGDIEYNTGIVNNSNILFFKKLTRIYTLMPNIVNFGSPNIYMMIYTQRSDQRSTSKFAHFDPQRSEYNNDINGIRNYIKILNNDNNAEVFNIDDNNIITFKPSCGIKISTFNKKNPDHWPRISSFVYKNK